MAAAGASNDDDDNTKKRKQPSWNVNPSSMASLLSEVSKHASQGPRGRLSQRSAARDDLGASSSRTQQNQRKYKGTSSIFDKSNRLIEKRSARDRSHMLARDDLSAEARRVLESREMLEKKAKLYEKLARGETVKGVTRDQLREGLLVDFELKAIEEAQAAHRRGGGGTSEDDDDDDDDINDDASDDEDEGARRRRSARGRGDDDDEMVEETDEFGRTRWIRKSELAARPEERRSVIEGGKPMYSDDIKLASDSWHPADNQNVYYGDQREFHVYQPTEEEIAERRKKLKLDEALNVHYDSTKEARSKAAGFMQLSKDEEERKRQLEELRNERLNTEAARQLIEERRRAGLPPAVSENEQPTHKDPTKPESGQLESCAASKVVDPMAQLEQRSQQRDGAQASAPADPMQQLEATMADRQRRIAMAANNILGKRKAVPPS